MTQYFHVDKSGDPGIHSLKGVPYFVLAMVQLPDREPIANFADLRNDLHVSQTFEFHYHQMSPAQKKLFSVHYIGNDVLILDGLAEPVRKALRIHLSNESKRLARVRPFKNIVSENSSHNDGLQLTDRVASAIRDRAWKQNSTNYQPFAHQVVDLWQVK